MDAEQFTVRAARPEEDAAIAALVIEGFIDKFRPIFRNGMDRSIRIMQRWIELEHEVGGVRSLVIEDPAGGGIAASVGIRLSEPREDLLSRRLWGVFRRNLGFFHTLWATTLLSYPRYTTSPEEAYVERLVVAPGFRRRGLARSLLDASERTASEARKRSVGLHVSCNNLPALLLYESAGYREVSRQRSLLTARFLGIRAWIYMRKEPLT
ncbi:GCN5-related N-acetyltransferase [Rubrobacter xylanophilus DSM 9941]|uniref:GCN5-related N-acetyltransferase n=1 Tax=Rubrobacter xylanophilus (strain DSM 9941 / JCM 11954 / NBRC 16129 / PRD-1) TaxID=266117 RepID=Q1AWZ7_RUBXD|nr:GNAT family N-acetyltransferase [Rubrobacter xylanophilus]ABG04081.1 GCN5-related N-acetyltransferase [Rubrobacter xylanophilus DSM 9941]